jgi:flavin reductase (DIM6/NTAB) family NADH-FMN oxidoreductase RutF
MTQTALIADYEVQAVELHGPVDQSTFRRVLGNFASGVTVVTVEHEGAYHGSTVASFCSLSLDPPLVLVCIDRHATSHAFIEHAGQFAVNILGKENADVSRHFASRNPNKFATIDYQLGVLGVPLLDDAIATLECRVVSQFPGGDHSIFVGEVLSAAARDDTQPLLYFRRNYHQLG